MRLLDPRVTVDIVFPPGLTADALAAAWWQGCKDGGMWGVAAGVVVGLLLGWAFFGGRR